MILGSMELTNKKVYTRVYNFKSLENDYELVIQDESPQAEVPLSRIGWPPKVPTALVISPQTSQLRRSNREKKL